jgi:hypothetical protein
MRAVKAKRLRYEQSRLAPLRAAGTHVPRRLRVLERWLERYRIGGGR